MSRGFEPTTSCVVTVEMASVESAPAHRPGAGSSLPIRSAKNVIGSMLSLGCRAD